VNAAKHAGVDRVDVYAEVGQGAVEVFVRDRGTGFDPDGIADDRMGVRGSIVGRVESRGGTARVRSGPDGTEVAITMPLSADPAASPEEPR
jgi:signal transduction histidine kinase